MIETIRQGLKADGIQVSISKLCQWFAVPRRTVYYRAVKGRPKVDPRFIEPIKAMIEENPAFGYRTVAHLLNFRQEHRAADLPAQGLAGKEAPDRRQASRPDTAVGGKAAE